MFKIDRDKSLEYEEGEYDEIKDQLVEGFDTNLLAMSEDAMDSIRMMVIVTLIMEITRKLTDAQKKIVRQRCKDVMERKV